MIYMKVLEMNVNLTKKQEDKLAELYNNFIEREEEFERKTGLRIISSINNYQNCIIKNARNKFILGKVYKNCISIGSGDIREFDTIQEIQKLNEEQLQNIEKYSKM